MELDLYGVSHFLHLFFNSILRKIYRNNNNCSDKKYPSENVKKKCSFLII